MNGAAGNETEDEEEINVLTERRDKCRAASESDVETCCVLLEELPVRIRRERTKNNEEKGKERVE